MVGRVGFEPTANCLRGNCSTGLSYRPMCNDRIEGRKNNDRVTRPPCLPAGRRSLAKADRPRAEARYQKAYSPTMRRKRKSLSHRIREHIFESVEGLLISIEKNHCVFMKVGSKKIH